MRFSPTLLLLLCFGGALLCLPAVCRAQQQDKGMMQRLDDEARAGQLAMGNLGKGKPYIDPHHDFSQTKTYKTQSAHVKDVYLPPKFRVSYFLTGVWHGSKDFWMGEFKYATTSARVKDAAGAKKEYPTKAKVVKEERDQNKTFSTQVASEKDVRNIKRGVFDPPLSGTTRAGSWQGAMDVMTIDQVRDLLNKNK